MTINSYGYEVMSLDEIIDALQQLRAQDPARGGRPIWVANCPPLFWPVKNIEMTTDNDGRPMLMVKVERGGN